MPVLFIRHALMRCSASQSRHARTMSVSLARNLMLHPPAVYIGTAAERLERGCLAIVVPNGMEDVEGTNGFIQCDDLVQDVAGDAIQVAGLQRLLFAADEEDRPSLKEHSDLLVRVGVLLD